MLDLTFGEQVKIVLKRKGMTIKELAELIAEKTGKKMSRQNMTQRLNRDNFQEQDMRMIAGILDCSFQLNILGEDTAEEDHGEEYIQETIHFDEPVEEPVVDEPVEEEQPVVDEPIEEEQLVEEPVEEEQPVAEVYEEELAYEEPVVEEIYEEVYEEEPEEEIVEEVYAEEPEEEIVEEVYEEEPEETDEFRETEELIQETLGEELAGEEPAGEEELEEPEATEEEKPEETKEEKPVKKKKHHSWKDYFQRMTGKHADKEAEGVKQAEVEEQKQQPEQEPSPKQEPVPEPEITEPEEEYKEELGEEFTEPEADVSPVEEEFAEAFEEAVAKENEQEEETEDLSIGEMNPYTGREYESNSVRMHPKRIGYVQVYSRKDHKWQDMTEWAFLGEQERKKVELGDDYVSPIYLD